jgi:hypothetical protein
MPTASRLWTLPWSLAVTHEHLNDVAIAVLIFDRRRYGIPPGRQLEPSTDLRYVNRLLVIGACSAVLPRVTNGRMGALGFALRDLCYTAQCWLGKT